MNPDATEKNKRNLRLAPFVLTLICFLLPFVQFSCQGQKLVTVTGLQLAMGTEVEQPQPFGGPSQKQNIPSEPTILLVLFCSAAATGTCFLAGNLGKLIPAIAGGGGFVLMLIAKVKFDNDVMTHGHGLVNIEYKVGFVLACISLLAGTALAVFQYKHEKPGTGSLITHWKNFWAGSLESQESHNRFER